METRKVEIWSNGQVGFSDSSKSTASTKLGESAVPLISEISKDPQFQPTEISRNEFEEVWAKRKS